MEILRLIADGLSDRAVAETVFIGQGAVRGHLTNNFAKLEVGSRTAAIAAARRPPPRHSLIETPGDGSASGSITP